MSRDRGSRRVLDHFGYRLGWCGPGNGSKVLRSNTTHCLHGFNEPQSGLTVERTGPGERTSLLVRGEFVLYVQEHSLMDDAYEVVSVPSGTMCPVPEQDGILAVYSRFMVPYL